MAVADTLTDYTGRSRAARFCPDPERKQIDMNETACRCELCGKELNEETVWITHHYGVCQDCYDGMAPEEIDEIIENYG